ncbi:MAG: hypothetical protein ACRDJ4_05480 [Actinomycetota bacterium]
MSTASKAAAPRAPATAHPLADRPFEELAERIAAMIAPEFLAEMGWDPHRLVLSPPDGHRLLVRPVCRVDGCSTTATNGRRICFSCQRRLASHGLGDDEIDRLPVPDRPRRGPGRCLVAGCGREWLSAPAGLCRAHQDQQAALGLSRDAFLLHPDVVALPPMGPCQVAACPRQRRHPDGLYCEAHQLRLRLARRHDPGVDEVRWRQTEPAVGLGGQVSLRGLPLLVVSQVLFGLQ